MKTIDASTIQRLRDTLVQQGRRPTMVMSEAYETLARQGMLGPEESAAVEWVEPIAEAMYLMMAADGDISEPERDALRGAVRALTEDVVRSGTVHVMEEGFQKRLATQGREARLQEIAEGLSDDAGWAEWAFALAASVAAADEKVVAAESELLLQLGKWLNVPELRREAILKDLAVYDSK